MRRIGFVGAALIFVMATWVVATWERPSNAQEKAPEARMKWEYTWTSGFRADKCNELGDQGWELCVAVKEDGLSPYLVFKRPKR